VKTHMQILVKNARDQHTFDVVVDHYTAIQTAGLLMAQAAFRQEFKTMVITDVQILDQHLEES